MHPGFDAALAVVAFGAALEPVAGWPLTIVARWSDRSVWMRAGLRFVRSPPPCRLPRLCVFTGRYDCVCAARRNGVMALAGVEGIVRCNQKTFAGACFCAWADHVQSDSD